MYKEQIIKNLPSLNYLNDHTLRRFQSSLIRYYYLKYQSLFLNKQISESLSLFSDIYYCINLYNEIFENIISIDDHVKLNIFSRMLEELEKMYKISSKYSDKIYIEKSVINNIFDIKMYKELDKQLNKYDKYNKIHLMKKRSKLDQNKNKYDYVLIISNQTLSFFKLYMKLTKEKSNSKYAQRCFNNLFKTNEFFERRIL